MMRAMERTARRCGVALRYSQGFNPRPRLSLVFPRSVGIATRDDLLMLVLDEPIEGDELLRQLNEQAPRGMRFFDPEVLAESRAPLPRRAHYELPLEEQRLGEVRTRVEALQAQPQWPIHRETPRKGRSPGSVKSIDLRPLVEQLSVEGSTLHLVLAPQGDAWARPSEVLRLLAMDERADLARITRSRVEYEM